MKESKEMVKKEVSFMKKKGAPKSMVKHEMAEAGMKKGGMAASKMGKVKTSSKPDGVAMKGKTKGKMVKMAKGGSVGSASKRADGCAQRGKTKGRMV